MNSGCSPDLFVDVGLGFWAPSARATLITLQKVSDHKMATENTYIVVNNKDRN